MRNKYIFDIPIYRTTRYQFNAEIDKIVEKQLEWVLSHDPQRNPLPQDLKDRVRERVAKESGSPWQFNQIIGWLRLFLEGSRIGCHPWWVDAKRINRRMKYKRFLMQTYSDIFQADCRNKSSEEIYKVLLHNLKKLAAEKPYKKRYVDLDVFCRLGPYVDWRRLIEDHIERK